MYIGLKKKQCSSRGRINEAVIYKIIRKIREDIRKILTLECGNKYWHWLIKKKNLLLIIKKI